MRLVNFMVSGEARLGVRVGDDVIDLAVAAPGLPRDLNGFLQLGDEAWEAARKAAAASPREAMRPLAGLKLLPPTQIPSKIVCLGVNYYEHAVEAAEFNKEIEAKRPDYPIVFMRAASSLVAHNEPLIRPIISDQLDYEGELAVVIGRRGRHISKEEALSYVAGYSCFNDGSVRDIQLCTSQWTVGKSFDGTGAFGPELVTPDELPPAASGLKLQTRLNGELMQNSDTSLMMFGVIEAISILSQAMTFLPGDLIVMGTCAGVGVVRKPPLFMKPGDVCEIEIEGIGVLSNEIAQERPEAAS